MSCIGRKIGSSGSLLDEIYALTISGSDDLAEPDEVQEPEPWLPQQQIGYFDIHPDSSLVMKTNSADLHRQPVTLSPPAME